MLLHPNCEGNGTGTMDSTLLYNMPLVTDLRVRYYCITWQLAP